MDEVTQSHSAAAHSLEALDAALDSGRALSAGSGLADSGLARSEANPSLVRLHELLRFPSVRVPEEFSDQVMALVKTDAVGETRSSSRSWMFALAGAAGLALVVALGSTAVSGESVLATIASAASSVALAGAGLLAATWTGVGTTVGSWIGTSPTVGAFLALAFVGAATGLAGGLRRTRRASQRNR